MKKILIVLALALSVAAPAFAIDSPGFQDCTIKKGTGTRYGDANREVKLVRFGEQAQNGASLVSGDLVVWDTLSDDGVTVTGVSTSADGSIAGIVCTTIPTADSVQNSAQEGAGRRNWGYIVVSGPMNVDVNAGANDFAVGDFFITSSDDTIATTIVNRTGGIVLVDVQEGSLREVAAKGGFFMDTYVAGDTTAEVYVQLN